MTVSRWFGHSIVLISAALASDGLKVKMLDQADAEHPAEWFYTIETAHDFVLYLAASDEVWSRFCLRQADRVLFVAHGQSAGPSDPMFHRPRQQEHATPADVIR